MHMAAYAYSAINADGLELSGEIHAPDTDAVAVMLERLTVTIPELNAATTARIPMFRTVIAISSSIRPKPPCCRMRART